VVIGEAFGHWFNDWIANRYIKKHHGSFELEVRLWTAYVGQILIIPGLIGVGQALENHAHWAILAVTWGLYVAGGMITATGLTAYCLQSYPDASGEISSWLNFFRTAGGFMISYVQVDWAKRSGAKTSLGIQAAIATFAFITIIPLLQIKGKALRHWGDPIRFQHVAKSNKIVVGSIEAGSDGGRLYSNDEGNDSKEKRDMTIIKEDEASLEKLDSIGFVDGATAERV